MSSFAGRPDVNYHILNDHELARLVEEELVAGDTVPQELYPGVLPVEGEDPIDELTTSRRLMGRMLDGATDEPSIGGWAITS